MSLVRADALRIPLRDKSVDLIVTSPPYFALRSYRDGGEHYEGQIGSEPTPQEFLEALWTVTRECVRVLKPSGSLWVNLGDKYSQRVQTRRSSHQPGLFPDKFEEFGESWKERREAGAVRMPKDNLINGRPIREKSLMGLPWRYALGCIDQLGLILRAEVVWSKPNGLPESVTDRVRRSHEQWFHFTREPRYFAAVDEVREPHSRPIDDKTNWTRMENADRQDGGFIAGPNHPLGKLPGSVWTVPSEPLRVPPELCVDHFAAFPTEFPRRIILGWSPSGICVECGEGRRPVVATKGLDMYACACTPATRHPGQRIPASERTGNDLAVPPGTAPRQGSGALGAMERPAVVLDPFCGTGTTVMVARALGRFGIGLDLSGDYLRLARWRIKESGHASKAIRRTWNEHNEEVPLFDAEAAV